MKNNSAQPISEQNITAQDIENFCNELLSAGEFKDYCPNGLQVDAATQITKIVTGVTASMALIDAAIENKANAILVHHGYFWKGEPEALTGLKGGRIRALMQHGISLLAYHLPLDAHPELGNNASLAKLLGFELAEPLYPNQTNPVGNILSTKEPINALILIERIKERLRRTPLHICPPNSDIQAPLKRIGLCTGAAQDFIDQAAVMGCDAYISGEISERTTHCAREHGIHYFACGHHATETLGIKNLGEMVAKHFGAEVVFVDIDNPA